MRLADLKYAQVKFEVANGRKPVAVALTMNDWYDIRSHLYMPGVKMPTDEAFRSGKLIVLGMRLLWRESVLV